MSLKHLAYILLVNMLGSHADLVVERTSGVSPDRFYLTSECKSDSCSKTYGADYMVNNSCQCVCPVSRPTFSIQNKTCIRELQECSDLSFLSRPDQIFTFLMDQKLELTPKIPVTVGNTSDSLSTKWDCGSNQSRIQLFVETTDGFKNLEETSARLITDEQRLFYIKIYGKTNSTTGKELRGLLIKLLIKCPLVKEQCLVLKINGIFSVASRSEPGITERQLTSASSNTAYIVMGIIIAAVALMFIVVLAIILRKKTIRRQFSKPEVMRLQIPKPGIGSNRNPAHAILRRFSLSDLNNLRATKKTWNKMRKNSDTTETSGDSGRGKSRPVSTTPPKKLVQDAYADAWGDLDPTSVSHIPEVTNQKPKLFNSQAQRLTTVHQGIASVPGERHILPRKSSKYNRFKRLLSRNKKYGSDLSIDYDAFHVTEVPNSKLFTESHINPEVSFNEEGKLAQSEEIVLDLSRPESFSSPTFSYAEPMHLEQEHPELGANEQDDHEMVTNSDEYSMQTKLPTTNIDDIA